MSVQDVLMSERKERLAKGLKESRIPKYMQGGLTRWILDGDPAGDFIMAIMRNDLQQTCNRADPTNASLIYDYVSFMYNYAPMGCWGSEENVRDWFKHRGLHYIVREDQVKRS